MYDKIISRPHSSPNWIRTIYIYISTDTTYKRNKSFFSILCSLLLQCSHLGLTTVISVPLGIPGDLDHGTWWQIVTWSLSSYYSLNFVLIQPSCTESLQDSSAGLHLINILSTSISIPINISVNIVEYISIHFHSTILYQGTRRMSVSVSPII